MSEFEPITESQENIDRYWEGPNNKFARYFTYVQMGFGLFNDTWKFIATAFTAYWTIKTADYWLKFGISDLWLTIGILVLSSVGVVVLGLMGRWQLYKLSKPKEFAVTIKSTITGFNPYNIQVRQVELLEEILNKLNEKK